MRTFSVVKGLPINNQSGVRVGRVSDFCISDLGQLVGLIVHRHSLFHRNFFLPIEEVLALNLEGIIIGEIPIDQKDPKESYLYNGDHLFGRMLLSDQGEELGLLQDVYFMEKTGTIIAYETTDGFFSELAEGKRFLRSNEPPAIGMDAIMISVYEE